MWGRRIGYSLLGRGWDIVLIGGEFVVVVHGADGGRAGVRSPRSLPSLARAVDDSGLSSVGLAVATQGSPVNERAGGGCSRGRGCHGGGLDDLTTAVG